MARKTYHAHEASNVLATVPSEPEVIAVFPELSSTVITYQQDIRLRRGDTLDIHVQVQNDEDPPEEYPIGDSVLRFGVKQGYGDTESDGVVLGNEAALILKRSYDPAEIKINGSQAIVYLKKADTAGLSFSPVVWDLEMTKPVGELLPPAGATVMLMANSAMVRAVGFEWPDIGIQVGDLFKAQGHLVVVNRLVGRLDIEVDYQNWASDSAAAFQAWRANVKTIAGGTFRLFGDVVM
jgi:hypothetical protein